MAERRLSLLVVLKKIPLVINATKESIILLITNFTLFLNQAVLVVVHRNVFILISLILNFLLIKLFFSSLLINIYFY